MKIICTERNYLSHTKELNNEIPAEPIFFMKPETALIRKNMPFFIPQFSQNIQSEIEIVLRINKLGKHIQKKFTNLYYSSISLGINFTALDIQEKCKQKGLPWEPAKAFDFSAIVSNFYPVNEFQNIYSLNFRLEKNGQIIQKANTSEMIFNFEELISYVSKYITLKIGDLFFTGTPAGVTTVQINDILTGYLEGKKMLTVKVK